MADSLGIPTDTKCQDCNKREAVVKYSDEPTFALTHGGGVIHICRQCYIKRVEKGIKDARANLEKQKRLVDDKRS